MALTEQQQRDADRLVELGVPRAKAEVAAADVPLDVVLAADGKPLEEQR